MSNVQFNSEEDADKLRSRAGGGATGLYRLVIQLGLAKNSDEAGKVLAAVAILVIIAAIAYPFLFG